MAGNSGTPGLCSWCSTTELRQTENHQPSQSSTCTAQVGLSHASSSHSVCAIRTLLGIDCKILSIRKEPMLSGFLGLNRLRKPLSTGGWWLSGCHSPVVWFPATSLVCFHFTLFTSKTSKCETRVLSCWHCDFTISFPSEDEYTIKFCSCCVKVCQQQQSLLLNMFLNNCVEIDWTQH